MSPRERALLKAAIAAVLTHRRRIALWHVSAQREAAISGLKVIIDGLYGDEKGEIVEAVQGELK